ncbi:MAG TPA: serine protease [Longimicrobium sp.]|nr:serine protease [Longimicrobium sp.]
MVVRGLIRAWSVPVLCAACVLAPGTGAHAQVPLRVWSARALVVHVATRGTAPAAQAQAEAEDPFLAGRRVEGAGSGVIVGRRPGELIVATARHVVRSDDGRGPMWDTVAVELLDTPRWSARPTEIPCETELDLAFLSVPVADSMAAVRRLDPLLARLPRRAPREDEVVYAVGKEWRVPSPGRLRERREDDEYLWIETVYLEPGFSGGGLFSATGDLVGLTSRGNAPSLVAVAIDSVAETARRCGIPLSLRRSPPDYRSSRGLTVATAESRRGDPTMFVQLEWLHAASEYFAAGAGLRTSLGPDLQTIGVSYTFRMMLFADPRDGRPGEWFRPGFDVGLTYGIEAGHRRTDYGGEFVDPGARSRAVTHLVTETFVPFFVELEQRVYAVTIGDVQVGVAVAVKAAWDLVNRQTVQDGTLGLAFRLPR